jgi:hypothetical protein
LRETETKRLEQDWIQKLEGFWRTFKLYFLSGEVNVTTLEQNFAHVQLLELRRGARRHIRPRCRTQALLMIARTETLNPSNGGQQTLWLEAKDAGLP